MEVEKILNHVFIEKHDLAAGYCRFEPSYDMAESWRRLRAGKEIYEHDIIMLKHELMELEYMAQGMNYDDAHKLTAKTYNYGVACDEWKKKHGLL